LDIWPNPFTIQIQYDMALISDFTRHFEDRSKYIAIFRTPMIFIFACVFQFNLDTHQSTRFARMVFSLGVRFDHRLVADNGGGQIGSTHPLSATGWARTVAAVYQAVAARKV
jgi:hypothetical protein